jgi:hypothetical protein
MEIYKQICGWEMYEVSNYGNVKSLKHNKLLKPQMSSSGYFNVTLSENGERYTPTIHSLVASHFIKDRNQTVNHIDGNKLNNNIENLEYVTYSDNLEHAHDIKLRKKTHSKNTKNTSGKVGVVWDNGYWVARGHKKGKAIYLGRSKNLDEAIKIREEYEKAI